LFVRYALCWSFVFFHQVSLLLSLSSVQFASKQTILNSARGVVMCCEKPKFHLARLVTSRHDSTRWTCQATAFWLCRACRTTWLDTLDTSSSTGSTGNLVCCVICIKLWYVSYSLMYRNVHLFNLFHLRKQIGFVYIRALKRLNLYRWAL